MVSSERTSKSVLVAAAISSADGAWNSFVLDIFLEQVFEKEEEKHGEGQHFLKH